MRITNNDSLDKVIISIRFFINTIHSSVQISHCLIVNFIELTRRPLHNYLHSIKIDKDIKRQLVTIRFTAKHYVFSMNITINE